MAFVEVNENFHILGGKDILEKDNEEFKEYRRKWRQWPESFYVGRFPLFIDIESTSVCDLRCAFCYNREQITGGFIKFELVKKIIDEGADNGLYGVKFNFRGEPLLHPQIHEFIRYAKNKGLSDVYFNTHAFNLNIKMASKLIDAGLDRVSISFEGYTKELYERYRLGSNFEMVLGNVDNLIKLRKKIGVDYPKIRVQSVLVPEMKEHLEEYKNFWLNLGVDEVACLDYKEMKGHRKGLVCPWACPQLWQRMCVWWDGALIPCNHDDRGQLSLGNVSSISIKEAWHAEELNRIRNSHKEGRAEEISACDGCYLRDSEILKLMQKENSI
jgi:radical SAM protein with 4Fe4S-binding SPASM domain